MSIQDLIDRIANVFNYTFVNKQDYNELKEQLETKNSHKEHCAYIKHWVNNMGCKRVYINWKSSTYGEFIDVVDICGDKIVYRYDETGDSVYDLDLDYIEIPESFKKEKLGKDYRTI